MPNPDCESYLQKSEISKYVECEFGHKYCFECLKPPHENKSCDNNIDTKFMNWKNKYQWCWLCEEQYNYGHYDSGKCAGHQFTKADNLEEIPKENDHFFMDNQRLPDYFGLHKILPCYYERVPDFGRPHIMKFSFFIRYCIMLLYFGFLVSFQFF